MFARGMLGVLLLAIQCVGSDFGRADARVSYTATLPTEKPDRVERLRDGLVAMTWTREWTGANTSGRTTRTQIVDEQRRVRVEISCNEQGGGGVCGAPNHLHAPAKSLSCDDALRCTSTEELPTDWTTRVAVRTFDLLTNETIPPKRFDAVTYSSGEAFAAAFDKERDAIRRRGIVQNVGLIEPLFELSTNEILVAAPPRIESVAARFFLLSRRPARWREIPLTRLADDGYPATPKGEAVLATDHTPLSPRMHFQADDLELPGKRRLVEVIAREGDSSAIYWVMIDPAGTNGALRVATDTPEWRHCVDVLFPPSATRLEIPPTGLPATIEAVHSWSRSQLDRGELPKRCNSGGTIDWSTKNGWVVKLVPQPCTNAVVRPFRTVISHDGGLTVTPCEPLQTQYGPGPDFAPPALRCVPAQ